MEEEDDDLYEPGDSLPPTQTQNGNKQLDASAENPAETEEFVEEEVEDDEVRVEFSHCFFE